MPSFFTAYVQEALRTETDNSTPSGGYPLDKNYTPAQIAPESMARMMQDCEAFQAANKVDLAELDDEQAGRDFWLTRNGHGAGFWDGDYEEPIASRLTESAHSFGECSLYIGDDDAIHHFPC